MVSQTVDLLKKELPLEQETVVLPEDVKTGLVLVDIINGFCTVGAGNLMIFVIDVVRCQSSDFVILNAVLFRRQESRISRLARLFCEKKWPVLAFLDSHHPNKPEDPYSSHCLIGTDESNMVPALRWLEQEPNVTIRQKDCFDGYLGSIQEDGSIVFADWIKNDQSQLHLCTGFLVFNFISQKPRVLPPLKDVVVYSRGCAIFDIPLDVARNTKAGLPHPQEFMHHVGLYMAKERGVIIANMISSC